MAENPIAEARSEAPLARPLRVYLSMSRGLGRLSNGVGALHRALWLGALSEGSLRALTDHHYVSTEGGGGQDVDYFGADFNLSGLRWWERDALDRYFGGCRSVLVGAAGGGREMHALAGRFERVDGFECNDRLAEACRLFLASAGIDARVFDSEPDCLPEGLATYDGAVLGWCALIHVIGRRQRVELLRDFHRHLAPGGPLLLSVVVRDDSVSTRITHRVANVIRRFLGRRPVEPGDRLSSTFDHVTTRDEIRAELEEAGFEMVVFERRLQEAHVVARVRPTART